MRIVPMTAAFAADLTTWTYAEPYAQYSLDDADPEFFTDPANGYLALVDDEGLLIGYRSFGADGQVPGYAYDDSALDTGGGLRPSLTGRGIGLGRAAIATGLAYGQEHFAPPAFRVTVASFNTRAQRVVTSLGFTQVTRFDATTNGQTFDVFVRQLGSVDSP
jgi:RimJ/RimL family protein N-acetyltransferase